MPELISKEKKEVIATMSARKVKEELKKIDFYKKFHDKIKDSNLEVGDDVLFIYTVKLYYNTKTNDIVPIIEGDIK